MSNSSVEAQTNAGAVVQAQGQTQKIASSTVYVVYNDIEGIFFRNILRTKQILSNVRVD